MPAPTTPPRLEETPPKDLELNSDRLVGSPGVAVASARSIALAKARQMPSATTLVPPISAAKAWIELGPSAIPNGEMLDEKQPGLLVSGRLTSIVIDPNDPSTIYLGTAMGGVWKTSDVGASWTPTCDQASTLAIGALAIDPSDSEVLYAGTGEGNLIALEGFADDTSLGAGIIKTTDAGANWIQLAESIFTSVCFFRIAINPTQSNIVFAATSAGLFRSVNGGTSWIKLEGGLPSAAATDVAIDPVNPSTVYVGYSDLSVFRSDD